MSEINKVKSTRRPPLSRGRVIKVAIGIADKGGLDQLSMRKLAAKLKVKAMSLYHHFANKEEILDSIVDEVFKEVNVPDDLGGWRAAMQARAVSLRQALSNHPWAGGLLESRSNPGPSTLSHHDRVLGILRSGGFSIEDAAHAYSVLDSYIYGFVLQEQAMPAKNDGEMQKLAGEISNQMPDDAYPYLTEMTTQYVMKPGYSFGKEFAFGLALILDGLERMNPSAS